MSSGYSFPVETSLWRRTGVEALECVPDVGIPPDPLRPSLMRHRPSVGCHPVTDEHLVGQVLGVGSMPDQRATDLDVLNEVEAVDLADRIVVCVAGRRHWTSQVDWLFILGRGLSLRMSNHCSKPSVG
jgi:hypothetical protein